MAFRCCSPRAKQIAKAGPDPAGRVTRTLTAQEQRIVNAFTAATEWLANRMNPDMIRRIVASGIDGLPMGDFAETFGPVVNALTAEVVAGGTLGVAQLPDGVKGSYRFDALDPRAIAWAQSQSGALIRDLSDETRAHAQRVIATAVESGWTTKQTADELQRVVGLHDRWARAVSNAWPREYDRLLGLGISEAEATRRATEFTNRYRDRLIRARAVNIARTEIITASNQGRWLSWAQGVEGGYISKAANKKWITGPLVVGKGRKQVCPICQGLRDETVPWDKPFSNGQTMPPAHPSCRCTAILVPLSIEEVEQRLRDADQAASAAAKPGYSPAIHQFDVDSLSKMDLERIGQAFGGETGEAVRGIDRVLRGPIPSTPEEIAAMRKELRTHTDRLQGILDTWYDPARGGKPTLNDLWDGQGYRGRMTVVDRDTYLRGERDAIYKTQYRGVEGVYRKTPQDIHDQLLKGDLWQGNGAYGQGTYAARALDWEGNPLTDIVSHSHRLHEARDYGHWITRMRFTDEARLIDHETVDQYAEKIGKAWRKRATKLRTDWGKDLVRNGADQADVFALNDEIERALNYVQRATLDVDRSATASLLGYDGIAVKGSSQGYTVVLNRTALVSDGFQGTEADFLVDLLKQARDGFLDLPKADDSWIEWSNLVEIVLRAELPIPSGTTGQGVGDAQALLREVLVGR